MKGFAVRALVAIATGFLLSALVAPWGYQRLHWVAYLPLFWALREETPRQNFWLVIIYGTVAEALIFSWITDTITLFSNLPSIVAWGVTGLFAVVFAIPYFLTFTVLHPMRKRFGDLWIVLLPAWLVVVEWLTSAVILFPYNQGVSQFDEPLIWQMASVTGVSGLSWVVLFFNAAFGEWIYRRREGGEPPITWMLSAISLVAVLVIFGAWRFAAVEKALAEGPVKRVQQLQSGDSMLVRMQQGAAKSFAYWVRETQRVPRGSMDLAVWPEASVPYQLNAGTAVLTGWDLVAAGDFDLVVGAGTREREADAAAGEVGEVRIFNSVYTFQRDRLVPDVPDLTALSEWDALIEGGCDLDAMHVYTPFEAAEFARAGQAVGGDAACIGKLETRASSLRAEMKVRTAFEERLRRDSGVWPQLRTHTARIGGALSETTFGVRRGISYWTLSDATCTDGDCLQVHVRCDADSCAVYPEAPHYDKMVPLPFGEYLPLASTFPWLADLIKGPGNFRAGTEAFVFDIAGTRVATPICYEGILGYLCDEFPDPDLFVNLTNDAWFGDTAASDLHGMLVAIRAVELGVPVFRSTYSGVSFAVEPHGQIYGETELFEPAHRMLPVRMATIDTVYSRFGDWFVALCAAMLLAALGIARRET